MTFDEILTELNIPKAPEGHHHSRPGWIQIDCPFCGKDSHKWHLGYSEEGKFLNCWQCGYHSLSSVLIEATGRSYREIKKLLGDLEAFRPKKIKVKGRLQMPKGVEGLHPAHRKYLWSRGYNNEGIYQLIKLWGIQAIGIASHLSWRIFIPIYYQGRMVSWTTRSISNKVTRYISASLEQESMPHKELLYGEDYVRHGIIIHEGPTDTWSTGPGAVSTFGIGYTKAQLNRMAKYPTRAVCFDNEPEAQKRANSLCDDLSVFPGETYNVQLDSKDPASASKKEIKKLRRQFL